MARRTVAETITYDLLFRELANEEAVLKDQLNFNAAAASAIRSSLFKEQRQLVDDPARWKSGLCPRRAGKSWCAMSYAHIVCLETPNARVVIATLTLKSAKNIYWKDMGRFAAHYGLSVEPYINELRIDFPNGSQIMLVGMESRQQIDKLRGGSYDLVIIDECKSFPAMVLQELLDDVVAPALADRLGTLLMIGTPGNILDGPFYQATMPGLLDTNEGELSGTPFSRTFGAPEPFWVQNPKAEVRWSRHHWNKQHNTYIPHLWQDALDRKRRNGWEDTHPTWIREDLGLWVASESAHVYAFAQLLRTNHDLVTWRQNGKGLFGLDANKKWHFLLGIDLGFEDDTAFVIAAYNDEEPILYHCWDEKETHLNTDQVGQRIQMLLGMVPQGFDAIVGDFGGGGKQQVMAFNARYSINIIPAEKRDKQDYQELLNSDFHSGRVKLLERSDLAIEMQILQWDLGNKAKALLAHTGRLREHPELPNHLCDAFLYVWRYSYHFFAQRLEKAPDYGSREWVEAQTHQNINFLLKARADLESEDWTDELKSGPNLAEEYFDIWRWS